MNDLISRTDAINVVAEGLKHVFVEYRDVAEKLLVKLPTVANLGNGNGVFIPEITVEMLRNASLEGIETLLVEGTMYDIDLSERSKADRLCAEWVFNKETGYYECSECGAMAEIDSVTGDYRLSKYCGECGAKMENWGDGKR